VKPRHLGALGSGLLWLFVGSAWAGSYDLQLGRLVMDGCSAECTQQRFDKLMTDLGFVVGPAFLSEANTLGLNGLEVSLESTLASVANDSARWKLASRGRAEPFLWLPRVRVQKGLPWSLQVGAELSHLPDSSQVVLGGELKAALHEGFFLWPDLALRASIQRVVGAKDYSLTTWGWDLAVSKRFAGAGPVQIAPYLGYSMMFIHASSRVLVQPMEDTDLHTFAALSWDKNLHNRAFVGCLLQMDWAQIAFEGIFSPDYFALYNLKLGIRYD
jgi:hypothetical protein